MASRPIDRGHLRSTEKCFNALELLNASGPMKAADLARRLGVPRTTAVRLLRTLETLGYVTRDGAKQYAVGIGVNRLSSGYRPADSIIPRIERLMATFSRQFVWPLTLVLPKADAMYTYVTTDTLTPFKIFTNPPGTRIPYFGTASGSVYLANCAPAEREIVMRVARKDPAARDVKLHEVASAIASARARGYFYITRWKIGSAKEQEKYSKDASVAIPLMIDDRAFGALTTRFIAAAVKTADVRNTIVPQLEVLGALIQDEWRQYRGERSLV